MAHIGDENAGCAPALEGSTMQKLQPTMWPNQADPHELLSQVGVGRATDNYRNDQAIFLQAEPAHAVFFIQKGRVKLSVTSEHGKEAIVGIMEEGQFFGEGCLDGHSVRTATATALGQCRIPSITKAAMLSAIRDQPKFTMLFMDHLLSRNNRIQEDVVDQLFNSSEKRLARLLLLLANYGKEGCPPIIPVILNQETLAEMIGTTRSRVSFFMNKFRALGYIDYNGKIIVHQSLLDSVLHDKPEIAERHPDMPELVKFEQS
jgi:CRP/FNR family cyclic AMP-dependent transcriptional regulator